MPDYLATAFLCVVLFLKCVSLIQDCNNFRIECNEILYENESCADKDEKWNYSDVTLYCRKPEYSLFEQNHSKKSFQSLDLFAYPITSSRDWLELKFIKITNENNEDNYTHVVNISNLRENCKESQEPFGTYCIWSRILTMAAKRWTVQLKIESEKSYAEFRFRLPNWGKWNNKEGKRHPCDFLPFVYSTSDKIYVESKNCTSRLNVTVLDHKYGVAEANSNVVQTWQNVTLNEGLQLDRPPYYNLSDYFSSKVDIVEDEHFTLSKEVLQGTDSTLSTNPDDTNSTKSSSQSYMLLYLIPFILCLVLTIAFLILRPEIKFIWKRITGQISNTKPSVKFLYCKCSGHAVYAKQLEALLNFIEKYCNVIIEDLSEKEYEDNEALLRRRNQCTDYIILVPMPKLPTGNFEDESNAQKAEDEFRDEKEKKRIILQVPFEGMTNGANYECAAAHFKLMDDFIPFVQHLHQKYSSERRDFLTVDKIMDIKQKLEDNHLTDGGFEFLINQFADNSNSQNNKINTYDFPDLNDLNL